MQVTLVALSLLVFSLIALFIALARYRYQRLIDEKKQEYQAYQKKNATCWKRFEALQVQIDRTKRSFQSKQLIMENYLINIVEQRKQIREVLEMLRADIAQDKDSFLHDLGKIIRRRKEMIMESWVKINGTKKLCLESRKDLQKDLEEINRSIVKKDQEYQAWSDSKTVLDRLKQEYEQIRSTSFFSIYKMTKA